MKQFLIKLVNSTKILFKQKRDEVSKRACFVYYIRFENSAMIYREAKALREKGFEVDIICLRGIYRGKLLQHYDGLNLYYIQSRFTFEKTTMKYFLRLFMFFIKSILLLSYLGVKKKYDLVHITTPPDFVVFTAIIPKLMGAKIILDIHDIGPELYMRKLHLPENHPVVRFIKFLEKISTKFADHIITVTDLWKDTLVSRSVPPSKCTVLLNVPDEDIFRPRSLKRQKFSNGLNLYYHGSLEEHFGVDTLLEAMPVMLKNIPDLMLQIYGGGRLVEYLKSLTKRLHIEPFVKFNGNVFFRELPDFLQDADIGVVPTKDSVFSNEALSMKSLEYISLGIPIVISKTKAHSYYYDDSMVRFFRANDKDDLAMAVIELFRNEEIRKKLAHNAQIFIQTYGWKKTKQKYYGIVDSLISRDSKG